jgi:hypothetical protein
MKRRRDEEITGKTRKEKEKEEKTKNGRRR